MRLCRKTMKRSIKMDELPFDHEDSLNHMAKRLADDDIATGYHTDWHHAYENAWEYLEKEYQDEDI